MKVHSKSAYELKLPPYWKIHPVFHVELLSTYHTNDQYGQAKTTPPPQLINGQLEYEVERVLKHQKSHRHTKYLVQWKGYSLAE